MLSVLLPVDGSESSVRAVRMVATMYQRLAPIAVRLLHVEVADGVAAGALGASDEQPAPDPLADAKSLLDAAGIRYTSDVRRGYVPSAIAEYAKTTGCDAIVMGTRGLGASADAVGSIARQVIGLTDLPVTLVK